MIQISSKTVKARKVHCCNLCFCKIGIGEKYNSQFNRYDNDVYTFKSHLRCLEIARELNMHDNCDEGLNDDTFQTHIREEFMSLMMINHSDIYNAKYYEYPIFEKQLDYVCEMHLKK